MLDMGLHQDGSLHLMLAWMLRTTVPTGLPVRRPQIEQGCMSTTFAFFVSLLMLRSPLD